MLSACLALSLLAAVPTADTIVVCPQELRPALRPWLAHRLQQGHECQVINGPTAEDIRAQIRAAAAGGKLKYVVLIGDSAAQNAKNSKGPLVPTHYAPAKVISRFRGGPNIATDNWFADTDDDQIPDLAIGRLTADTPQELKTLIEKTISYERGLAPGEWRRRISLVAGLGGFGQMADTAIETVAKRLLIEGIPPAYTTTVTYGSWRSPYCPLPTTFHDTTMSRFNEGCLFWVYMGHGQTREVDRMRAPDKVHHILKAEDCSKIQCGDYPPIALLLCCNAGEFDAGKDCLAEEMLRAGQGPVAIIAGSRVTMPYGGMGLGVGMLRSYFRDRAETLGDLLLAAKRESAMGPREDENSKAIDALALMLNPASSDLKAERLEHLELFNLIGDPLLRLPHADEVRFTSPAAAAPGAVIEIAGTSVIDGTADVELVVRRDRLTFRAPARPKYETTPASAKEYKETYDKANDSRLVSTKVAVRDGVFRARLTVPATASGACHVRVIVHGAKNVAVGSSDIDISEAASAKLDAAAAKPGSSAAGK